MARRLLLVGISITVQYIRYLLGLFSLIYIYRYALGKKSESLL